LLPPRRRRPARRRHRCATQLYAPQQKEPAVRQDLLIGGLYSDAAKSQPVLLFYELFKASGP
jgi:hypothetical protein